jgi:peroxiredoxin Q/BCP
MTTEGAAAPPFCLPGIDAQGSEKTLCLEDFLHQGRDIILYFYPKDNTPGCTAEACDFRDSFDRLSGRAIVLGVSPDTIASHKKFQAKHQLNFPLLSDPGKKVLGAYEAYGDKSLYGLLTRGVIRSTYLVDAEGRIIKKWIGVKAKGHVDTVLEFLLQGRGQPAQGSGS